MSRPSHWQEFTRTGHLGTLFTAFLYFDLCFAVWVLNGAMAPFLSEEFALSPSQVGLLVSVPVFAGALLRLPLGILAEYIGRKSAAQVNMAVVTVGLFVGWLYVDSYAGAMLVGIPLGIAGASFGVALSLGSGWYPPRFKGLAMGIAGAGNSGAVLAVLFAPPIARAHGWQAAYAIAACPLVGAMICMWLFAAEPPDREKKPLADYLRVLVDRDAWVFTLMYMVTFGGYIGLTSFLPTLFHVEYGVPKESVGKYAAGIVIAASVLRVAGGWLSDRLGGIRMLTAIAWVVAATTLAAASLPSSPWVMVAILVVCFGAMGAGNGAVFQLVPLRFAGSTAVASSLIGEIGALAGALVPIAMGVGREWTGSFAPGFLCLLALCGAALMTLLWVARQWIGDWVAEGGRAIETRATLPVPPAAPIPVPAE
jgi:NNP family nitrate/nitrite transporter-like MFS transporter